MIMLEKEISELSPAEAAAELKRIAEEMAKADEAYYQNDDPYLTDAQYDALKRRNELIEKRFPELKLTDGPSVRIGAAAVSYTHLRAHETSV